MNPRSSSLRNLSQEEDKDRKEGRTIRKWIDMRFRGRGGRVIAAFAFAGSIIHVGLNRVLGYDLRRGHAPVSKHARDVESVQPFLDCVSPLLQPLPL